MHLNTSLCYIYTIQYNFLLHWHRATKVHCLGFKVTLAGICYCVWNRAISELTNLSETLTSRLFGCTNVLLQRRAFQIKKIRSCGHMSKLGQPYLPKKWYFEICTILLYKYGHPYRTYLPQKFLSKLFSEKVWLRNTLLSYNLDICQKFLVFFFNALLIFKGKGFSTVFQLITQH